MQPRSLSSRNYAQAEERRQGSNLLKKSSPRAWCVAVAAVGRAAAWPALRHGRRQCLARARHPGAALIRTSRM